MINAEWLLKETGSISARPVIEDQDRVRWQIIFRGNLVGNIYQNKGTSENEAIHNWLIKEAA